MNMMYQTPELLEQIMHWEREFSREVAYLETPTGLFLGLNYQEEGYFCTPVDAIPFASIGVDGIHYALLTDFGAITDLNEASVIRVSPMDSEKVRLVARNVHDFFCLHLYDELLLLNEFLYDNEETYAEGVRKEQDKDLNSEWFDYDRFKREKQLVQKVMQEKFNIQPMITPVKYVQEIRLERSSVIRIMTDDSLGIADSSSILPLEHVQLFASIRNLQHAVCSDKTIVERHAQELLQLGMIHESKSLAARLLNV